MYKFRSDVQEESGSSFTDPHAESSQNYEWWVQHWTEKKKKNSLISRQKGEEYLWEKEKYAQWPYARRVERLWETDEAGILGRVELIQVLVGHRF